MKNYLKPFKGSIILCISLFILGCNNPLEKQSELELAQNILEKK